jgi:hypothetical protein
MKPSLRQLKIERADFEDISTLLAISSKARLPTLPASLDELLKEIENPFRTIFLVKAVDFLATVSIWNKKKFSIYEQKSEYLLRRDVEAPYIGSLYSSKTRQGIGTNLVKYAFSQLKEAYIRSVGLYLPQTLLHKIRSGEEKQFPKRIPLEEVRDILGKSRNKGVDRICEKLEFSQVGYAPHLGKVYYRNCKQK